MVQGREVQAAGAVVFAPGRRVLLVHRPRYDDWSFPKGKLDPGEHRTAAAVREVEEETGLWVRLGPPLPEQHYAVEAGRKTVHYWVGRVVGDDDVSGYAPNAEIDQVAWVDVDKAVAMLTYSHDRDTLADARRLRRRSEALVVLRHGTAVPRKEWAGADPLRPIAAAGRREAESLIPVLTAYDVGRVVTSSATRCVDTVAPYAAVSGTGLVATDAISEEGGARGRVRRLVADLLEELEVTGRGGVLCTHRPVLPMVFEALGVPDPVLDKGEALVVHVRRGSVLAVERQP